MNLLGVGPLELLLIVVVALIVLGPEKLPEVMTQVGKAINDFRKITSQLSDEFNRSIQTELNEARSVVDETRGALGEARSSVNQALTAAPTPPSTAPETPPPAPAEVATRSATQPEVEAATEWHWEAAPPAANGAHKDTEPVPAAALDGNRPAAQRSVATASRIPDADTTDLLPPY